MCIARRDYQSKNMDLMNAAGDMEYRNPHLNDILKVKSNNFE